MPAFIFTSNQLPRRLRASPSALALGFAFALALATTGPRAFAADTPESSGSSGDAQKGDRTNQPEDEDFTNTPYTRYGEFNSEKDEEEDTNFFQYGRFFGVAIGGGYEAVTGNRGQLWQGGFPLLDFKLMYWFTFNFAMDLDLYTANHFFTGLNGAGTETVNLIHLGIDLRYYFDTKDLSAPISFANPYVTLGVGSYTNTTNSANLGTQSPDTSIGVAGGLGVEFALSPRKVYLDADVKVNWVQFSDTYDTDYSAAPYNLPNLTGLFITFTTSILFTW